MPLATRNPEFPLALTSIARSVPLLSTTKSPSRSVDVRQNMTSGVGTWPSRRARTSFGTRVSRSAPDGWADPPSQSESAGSLQ